jgi:hypothetical protein
MLFLHFGLIPGTMVPIQGIPDIQLVALGLQKTLLLQPPDLVLIFHTHFFSPWPPPRVHFLLPGIEAILISITGGRYIRICNLLLVCRSNRKYPLNARVLEVAQQELC